MERQDGAGRGLFDFKRKQSNSTKTPYERERVCVYMHE